MLRSIFSLIHRILDSSEKKYNNTKSKAVIYCFTNPDNTVNMNLEMAGETSKMLRSVEGSQTSRLEPRRENSFTIQTEQGDVVTCRHGNRTTIVPKGSSKDDLLEKEKEEMRRITFSNTEELKIDEDKTSFIDLEVQPNVRELIENIPKKRLEISSKGKDQISLLLEQIQKMKTGLERLQEIAIQFNCSERFAEDINYLINNVRPHLESQSKKNTADKKDVTPKA